MLRRTSLILLLLSFSALTHAIPILDQESPNINASFNVDMPRFTWQQQVVAGVRGLLTGVEFFPAYATYSLEFYVNVGTPWQTDPHDFFAVLTGLTPDTVFVDVSSAGILLAPGDSFVLGFHGLGAGTWIRGNAFPGRYPGDLWLNAEPFSNQNWDIGFRTYVEPIPEPATLAILAAGLVVLGIRRRRPSRGSGAGRDLA